MSMEVDIQWMEQATFVAETDSGHHVTIDGPQEAGGQNRGPRPMELLLLGLGSCSAFDVIHILQRSRTPAQSCTVHVKGKRAAQDPKIFTRIQLHFKLRGSKLTPVGIERAIRLSAQKYCSAAAMLGAMAQLAYSYDYMDSNQQLIQAEVTLSDEP